MVFDIFSKRKKRESELFDVFQYENFPDNLKIQIIHLFKRYIGPGGEYSNSRVIYTAAVNTLREEYGVFSLWKGRNCDEGTEDELFGFFLGEKDVEKCLDVVDLLMRFADCMKSYDLGMPSVDAERTLNARFRESAVGYQFENGSIIRIDSQFIHSDIVKPVLTILSGKDFIGANKEFLNAHRYYRNGDFESCLVECCKSLESTIKIICSQRGWIPLGDTASKLIDTIFKNEMIPSYLQTQFSALRAVLEAGTPTIRNKEGGHGQGKKIRDVPDYLVSYVLHQTAAVILFLVQAHKNRT